MGTLYQGNQQSSTDMPSLNAAVQTPMTLNALITQNHLWGCVSCFWSGCRVCSHPTKNNNASRIEGAVWSCSNEIKRIFRVGMWQWMKHGSTTTHLAQKDRQLSGQQLVKFVQSDQKLNSELVRLWHPYVGARIVFCLSAILRKVKPLKVTIT